MRKFQHYLTVLAISALAATSAFAAPIINLFASGTDPNVQATGPDSVTAGNGSVWVAYTNGADSTGMSGQSVVVQYASSGTFLHKYTIAGYVDGLKINPADGKIWVMQNQDGNSTLTIIDPSTNTAGPAIPYSVTSGARGYDDVVFKGGLTFLSYTNPSAGSDPTIQQLVNGSHPLAFSANLLTSGASGINLATGMSGATTDTDPDSLKLTPGGALMLTSGSDGQLIFVTDPGGANTVSFLQLLDPSSAPVSSLDDAIFPNSSTGTFYLADTGNNRVLSIHATGLTAASLFASVGSLQEFGSVDTSTGIVSPFVTSFGAVNLSSPHGVDFVADVPEPGTSALALLGLAVIGFSLRGNGPTRFREQRRGWPPRG